jgi:hypothetical protein
MTAKESGLPSTPDRMQPVPGDPQSFKWEAVAADSIRSWEVRTEIDGAHGRGELALAAFARRTLPMQKALGALLFDLMLRLSPPPWV